ncbi:MAG TPA: efflux RND transporter periplasmic adaptor subunit [Pirellulales bacterium]|nr:efflux RND transporter periplasmic adaptor subunit [Pirellulales bacterium]
MPIVSQAASRLLVRSAVVSITLLSLLGCERGGEQLPPLPARPAAAADAVTVTVEPVAFRAVQRTVGIVGTLHGYEEITLGAKIAGRVRKITHDVSDRVHPGELLLDIEPTDFELNVRQAQRSLQVELAKLGLTELPGPKVDLRHIPTVVQAQLRRENAKKRLDRAQALVERKAGTEEDVSEKRSDFQVAQAEYDNQVLLAQAGIAAIHVKQEALSIAKQQLQDTLVKVPEPSQPIPGLAGAIHYAISGRLVGEGSYVMVGDPLVKLVIERPLKFRGLVPERKSSEVRVGQKAEVHAAAFPAPVPGEVTRINPAVDPKTRTFEVEILVPNMQGELKPGGFAKAGILTAVDDHAAIVPLESLVQFAGVTKIFLVRDGRAQEVQVTLGMQGNEWVEIASPSLAEGSQVITSGQSAIATGTPLVIRAEQGISQPSLAAESAGESRGEPREAAAPVARREATP